MASNLRQQTCFSFFMPQKSFNKPFEFLLYKTNRLHFSVCVYCNRSQKTSQRVKNNSHATRLRLGLFCSLHAVTSSVIYYSTHSRKNVIYLLIIQNVTSVCIFIGCWPWSIKGHTHRWRQIHVNRLGFLFSCSMILQYPPRSFGFLSHKTNRLHFSVCVL